MLLSLDRKRIILILILFLFFSNLFSLQLGNGNDENQFLPVKITDNVKHVATSDFYTMIIRDDDTLWATGDNQYGQFGTDVYKKINSFVYICDGVKSVETMWDFSLIIRNDNSLWISGRYPLKLSSDQKIVWDKTHNYIKIDDNVVKVSAGSDFFIYLKSDGSLWGVGSNTFGQLGLGILKGVIQPKLLQNNVIDIFADLHCSYYIDSKNDLYLSGSKTYFLDNNNKEVTGNKFVKVFSDVKSISTCLLLKTNGDLYSFGYGCYGALGIGKKGSAKEPVTFVMHDVISISSSQEHSLVILTDGTLLSSGGGSHCNFGSIGDGTTNPSYSFIPIMENVKDISVGNYYSMVIKNDGSLWTFGVNNQEPALSL